MRIVQIRNNTVEIKLWIKEFIGFEEYLIPNDNPLILTKYATHEAFIKAITNGEASIGDGNEYFLSPVQQLQWLQNEAFPAPLDADGAPIVTNKTNSSGWTYQKLGIDFHTCNPESLVCMNFDGSIDDSVSLRCYDSNNVLLETQENRDLYCVKTVVDWMPRHDIELIGGAFKTIGLQNARIWFVAVPDYPAAYGGQKQLAKNISLAFDSSFVCDGRNRKKLLYNNGAGTNKFRAIITHQAGQGFNCQFLLEAFLP